MTRKERIECAIGDPISDFDFKEMEKIVEDIFETEEAIEGILVRYFMFMRRNNMLYTAKASPEPAEE